MLRSWLLGSRIAENINYVREYRRTEPSLSSEGWSSLKTLSLSSATSGEGSRCRCLCGSRSNAVVVAAVDRRPRCLDVA